MDALSRNAWVWAVLGLLLFAVGAGWALVHQDLDLTARVLLGSGVASLLAYLWLDRQGVQQSLASRAFQLGFGSSVIVVLAAAIVGTGMVIAKKHDHQFDVTRDHRRSLSDHAVQVLGALQQPVKVVAFFGSDAEGKVPFTDLVAQIQAQTDQIEFQVVDPLEEPLIATEYAITSTNGTVILQLGEARQRLESRFDETAFIDALTRLQNQKGHTICWSTGHGEADPDGDGERSGTGVLVRKLEDTGYKVVRSSLLEGIAKTCEVLVVAGARVDPLPAEREAFAAFVAGGGKAVVMLEPLVADGWADDLERFGVGVGHDVVVEDNPYATMAGFDASYLMIRQEQYDVASPITRGLKSFALLANARSLTALDKPGLKVTELVKSSEFSWAETGLDAGGGAVAFDEGQDRKGPITLAVTVEVEDPAALHVLAPGAAPAPTDTDAPTATLGAAPDLDAARGVPADFAPQKGGRVVVFGDADFAGDGLIIQGNNQDLALNALAWLVDDTAQLAERPKADAEVLSPDGLSLLLHSLLVTCCLPAGTLIVGGLVLVRRRYL